MRCRACNKPLEWDESAFCEGYCFDCFNEGNTDISLQVSRDVAKAKEESKVIARNKQYIDEFAYSLDTIHRNTQIRTYNKIETDDNGPEWRGVGE